MLTRTAVTSTHFSLALHSVSAAHLRSPTNEALVPQAVRSKKTHFMLRLDTTRVCFALLSFAACTRPPPQPTPAPAAPVLVAPKAEEGPNPDEFAKGDSEILSPLCYHTNTKIFFLYVNKQLIISVT